VANVFAAPITTPPAANAPKMPSTRPRTRGVCPMYFQPSRNWRLMLCWDSRWRSSLLPPISRMPNRTVSAVTSRDSALR
jgi:hypothetical protein